MSNSEIVDIVLGEGAHEILQGTNPKSKKRYMCGTISGSYLKKEKLFAFTVKTNWHITEGLGYPTLSATFY